MRRFARTAMVALAALAVVWSGLWLAGRIVVGQQIDAALSGAAPASGLDIAVAGRSIGGFPFAYEVRLDGVTASGAGGGGARLPRLDARIDPSEPGRLVLRLPATFELLPGGGGAPVEVEAAAATLTIETGSDAPQSAQLAADSLLLVSADATGGGSTAVELIGVDLRLSQPGMEEVGLPRAAGTIGRLDFAATGGDASGGRLEAEGTLEDLRLSGQATVLEPGAIAGLVSGVGPGRAEATLIAGRLEAVILSEPAAPPADGGAPDKDPAAEADAGEAPAPPSAGPESAPAPARLVAFAGAAPTLSATVEAGSALVTASLMGSETTVSPPGGEPLGALATGPVEARHRAPLAPSEEFSSVNLSVRIEGARPDAKLWQRLDPDAEMPREPGRLDLAIAGTARLTKPFSAVRPGEAAPVAFGNLEIERMVLEGLGARAEAMGAVEFGPAMQRPVGTVTVGFEGIVALMRRLHAAGLIDQQQLQALATMVAVYTRAEAGSDRLRTDIALGEDGLRVNGMRVR